MTEQPSTMTALKSKTKSLTKLKIRRKLQKINLPKEIRYIEANTATCVFFYGNQLTGNLKLVYYITLFKTSKTLTSETLTSETLTSETLTSEKLTSETLTLKY